MFNQWLRNNRFASMLLAIVRIYLGYEFFTAGLEKLTGAKAFTALGFLKNSVAHPVLTPEKTAAYPLFNSFLNNFAIPHVGLFNFLVPWGELLVGIGLILGVFTTTAMFFGLLMNFMYLFAGTVSTNPLDILLGVFVIAAGFNAGKFGGDYWVIPWIRNRFGKTPAPKNPVAPISRKHRAA